MSLSTKPNSCCIKPQGISKASRMQMHVHVHTFMFSSCVIINVKGLLKLLRHFKANSGIEYLFDCTGTMPL